MNIIIICLIEHSINMFLGHTKPTEYLDTFFYCFAHIFDCLDLK